MFSFQHICLAGAFSIICVCGWLLWRCRSSFMRFHIRTNMTGVPVTPVIVCLCGSTRFFKEFMLANYNETMANHIVLSVGFYPHSSEEAHGEHIGITAADKARLDDLHKRKIDLADEVLVLNVGGYIGESTRSEIDYAVAHRKRVRYLEQQCSIVENAG